METIMEVIQTINIEKLTQEQFRNVIAEIYQSFAEIECANCEDSLAGYMSGTVYCDPCADSI